MIPQTFIIEKPILNDTTPSQEQQKQSLIQEFIFDYLNNDDENHFSFRKIEKSVEYFIEKHHQEELANIIQNNLKNSLTSFLEKSIFNENCNLSEKSLKLKKLNDFIKIFGSIFNLFEIEYLHYNNFKSSTIYIQKTLLEISSNKKDWLFYIDKHVEDAFFNQSLENPEQLNNDFLTFFDFFKSINHIRDFVESYLIKIVQYYLNHLQVVFKSDKQTIIDTVIKIYDNETNKIGLYIPEFKTKFAAQVSEFFLESAL